MSSIWDSTLRDFRDRVASREPVPGGGSVAAVAATQGLALVIMALEISVRRKDARPELEHLLKQGRALLGPLSDSADEDAVAFGEYMDAFRLPKTSPEDSATRARALAHAISQALEAPLRAAERCLEGLVLAHESMKAVHRDVASDVGAGAALLQGALTAVLYNVDINVRGITDPNEFREALASRQEMQRKGDELAYIIHREAGVRIAQS